MLLFRHHVLLCMSLSGLLICACSRKSDWIVLDSAHSAIASDLIRQVELVDDTLRFVGTYGAGLYEQVGDSWQKVGEHLGVKYILAIRRDARGDMWVGSARGGLLHRSRNGWRRYTAEDGLASNTVWDVLFLGNDTLLLGLRYGGAWRLTDDSLSRLSYEQGLPDHQVTALARDSSGVIWIGTVRGGMVGLRDTSKMYVNKRNGLSGNYIRCIVCDSTPRWVGSWDGGLDRRVEDVWVHQSEIPAPVVYAAYDANRNLWVGTWGAGVFYRSEGTWRHISPQNSGLPDGHVLDIEFAQDGRNYFATNKGVAVWKRGK
ncbi:MAG: hypothetical protein GF398_14720 [Chitinivibrionales bacterium]|nr:hypothetical protein [Chitinivibrionales bacterium]